MSGPFTLALQDFAAKAGQAADGMVHDVVTDIVSIVDERSPVGNPELWLHNRAKRGEPPDYVHYLAYNDPPAGYIGGHFRANWQLGADTVPVGEVAGVDPSGEQTTARNFSIIPEKAAGPVYTLTNNLPYAMELEYGHSSQQPEGIVGRTAVEFQGLVEERVKRWAV